MEGHCERNEDSGAECCVRVVGGAVQLMSDFQMSRVSRSGYRLYCRGCHRPRPPHLRGEPASASGPLGRALVQTKDFSNGQGQVVRQEQWCVQGMQAAVRSPHWPGSWYIPESEQLLLASFILQVPAIWTVLELQKLRPPLQGPPV